ncbi:LINE-1 reverse transcriptase like, partial [Trifolium medium]|nr:LINE-1 reverse transcriptase like [Trifolium medium]
EDLAGMMRRAVEIGRFKGFHVNDNIQFQILQFADDTILMGEDVIPFRFLGIPVGANPRRKETWKPMVEAMTRRLSCWNSRHLSFGGRITLINSLVRIQRNFLWGGGIEDKKLGWVKLEQICLPKDQGGLGVKNLEFFNAALLSKWKWRFLVDGEAVWSDLLKFRYGHLPTRLMTEASNVNGSKESIWWKDVLGIGRLGEDDWFKSNIGCGLAVLVMAITLAFGNLSDKLNWNGVDPVWMWQWRDTPSDIENRQLLELQNLLAEITYEGSVKPQRYFTQSA